MATRQQRTREKTRRRRTAPASALPIGHHRAKPGTTGQGEYYHVEIRPSTEFKTFRTQDVGKPGGIERVAGKRSNGSWDTQKWLIGKHLAHIENGRLVPDSSDVREILNDLGTPPARIRGDRFKARPRRHASEAGKTGTAQRRAGRRVIKAQAIALHRI